MNEQDDAGRVCLLLTVHIALYLLLQSVVAFLVRGTFCLNALLCRLSGTADNPALFSPAQGSMQLFMWQADIVGVAHFVMDCFDLFGAAPCGHDDGYSDSDSSSSALAAG